MQKPQEIIPLSSPGVKTSITQFLDTVLNELPGSACPVRMVTSEKIKDVVIQRGIMVSNRTQGMDRCPCRSEGK
jgi:ferredoxin-thioredoxin reductase catalytic subunit